MYLSSVSAHDLCFGRDVCPSPLCVEALNPVRIRKCPWLRGGHKETHFVTRMFTWLQGMGRGADPMKLVSS